MQRISEITDQSLKEEEPTGKYSGTAAESIGRTCTVHEEDIRQRMKTDPELSQDHSGEIVYQKEICNVSQALLQGKRAAEWLKQHQNILGQKQRI